MQDDISPMRQRLLLNIASCSVFSETEKCRFVAVCLNSQLCMVRKPEAAQCFIKDLSRIMVNGSRMDQNMKRQRYWSESITSKHGNKNKQEGLKC